MINVEAIHGVPLPKQNYNIFYSKCPTENKPKASPIISDINYVETKSTEE